MKLIKSFVDYGCLMKPILLNKALSSLLCYDCSVYDFILVFIHLLAFAFSVDSTLFLQMTFSFAQKSCSSQDCFVFIMNIMKLVCIIVNKYLEQCPTKNVGCITLKFVQQVEN